MNLQELVPFIKTSNNIKNIVRKGNIVNLA